MKAIERILGISSYISCKNYHHHRLNSLLYVNSIVKHIGVAVIPGNVTHIKHFSATLNLWTNQC